MINLGYVALSLGVVGIECTGSYGAGDTRAMRAAGLRVMEVNQRVSSLLRKGCARSC